MAEGLETVTDASFAEQVEGSSEPFLLEFTSPWCAPCAALEPVLIEVGAEHTGRMRIGKLNIADDPVVAERFGVLTTPTMILFKEGEPVRRLMGNKTKRSLLEALSEHV